MILDKLILRNFGLFGGEQVFELAPVCSRGKQLPITLVGGINGGGKTTLLDAVQLVLYGNRARCSKRSEKPYEQFLRESIHHGASRTEGAAVQLSFRYVSDNREHCYEVSRSWSDSGGRVRERVQVSKDDALDGWMSDNWSQLVEELIPHGIAQLCFFDAEKIRFLAEDETSTQALGDAIKSLLGLDLAERLIADAIVLEGRIAKRACKSPELQQLQSWEDEFNSKQSEIDRVVQEIGTLENPRLAAQDRLRSVEEQFARMGGGHWEHRTSLKRRQSELEGARNDSEQELVDLAATDLPLVLIAGLVDDVAKQADRERLQSDRDIVTRLLKERDQELLAFLKTCRVTAKLRTAVAEFLESDLGNRSGSEEVDRRLRLSDAGQRLLDHLRLDGFAVKQNAAKGLLDRLNVARLELEEVQRSIAAAPQEDTLRGIAELLKSASTELALLEQRLGKLERQLVSLRAERDVLQKQIQAIRRKLIDEEIRSEEDARLASLVKRTQERMKDFLRLATTRKISRLSEFITESFRYLLRKQTLIQRVSIDPETFAITLHDDTGRSVAKERLSEGEKQIFAVSVLWGLSRASARPLPTIIDTPMARLDAKHRDQLVERYFPHASHQVIVLSTDTEVERRYFQALQPHIARAYHLNYDEMQKITVAERGYFWCPAPNGETVEATV